MVHFNEEDYREIGKSLLTSIFVMEGERELVEKEVGFSKDWLCSEIANMIDIIEKEESSNFESKDILSDSDPEGDKLEIEEVMGNMENGNLKKKIRGGYDKPEKSKSTLKKN